MATEACAQRSRTMKEPSLIPMASMQVESQVTFKAEEASLFTNPKAKSPPDRARPQTFVHEEEGGGALAIKHKGVGCFASVPIRRVPEDVRENTWLLPPLHSHTSAAGPLQSYTSRHTPLPSAALFKVPWAAQDHF